MMTDASDRRVTFIENDLPALVSGAYEVKVAQTVNQTAPGSFTADARFAVSWERFSLPGTEVQAVFPPPLSVGEFSGVLPHVVVSKRTLPWGREAQKGNRQVPWLAVLTFNDDEYVKPEAKTAKDLVALGQAIDVQGSVTRGVGALPSSHLSYPDISPLDYGETPDDACNVIDLPLHLFNLVAPSLNDLQKLAHIRRIDTIDTEDSADSERQVAVVVGNRLPREGATAYAVLVSLEHMDAYLPGDDGTPSGGIPAGTTHVRLIALREWRFFNSGGGRVLVRLLEGLNRSPDLGVTSLRMPPAHPETPNPAPGDVQAALEHQASGSLSPADADVLVQNAFAMGYTPMNHHLRDSGTAVSWYRGPLAPFDVDLSVAIPSPTSDGMLRFDPETGMFDVSYGAAWQLGQLIGLQSKTFANRLYEWKRGLKKGEAAAAEQDLLEQAFVSSGVFSSLLKKGRQRLHALRAVEVPQEIIDFVARMRLLDGVPFAYLVPNELMLPPESLRWFRLDPAWIRALVDGAFSIGRASLDDVGREARMAALVDVPSRGAARVRRPNQRPANLVAAAEGPGTVTGFMMRSEAVSGWPRLRIKGYQDTAGSQELAKLRFVRLSKDVLLCLFDGEARLVTVGEPPEALHCGVEGEPGAFTTTLRQVTGDTPGRQYPPDSKGVQPVAAVPNRDDGQTLMIEQAAASIDARLKAGHGETIQKFTSAELALELIQGAVQVNYEFENG